MITKKEAINHLKGLILSSEWRMNFGQENDWETIQIKKIIELLKGDQYEKFQRNIEK